jgi:CheY-like chemotaxis protein
MKKILVADDDRNILYLISEVLAKGDYEVFQAVNGDHALRLAREASPDLIVLDIMMPGLDGFKVLQELKSDPQTRGIKVVVISARTKPEDVDMGMAQGADHYFSKPFKISDLTTKIRELLD